MTGPNGDLNVAIARSPIIPPRTRDSMVPPLWILRLVKLP